MFKIIKNKKLRIFIIIVLILVVISGITAFIFNILKDNYRSLYKVGENLVFEQTYNTIFDEIDIETKMSDIDIKVSNDNTIKVVIYGEEDYVKIVDKNNKLFIDINPKNIIAFDFYSCISKIELYLPSLYSNLIRIDSEFGNITLDEFINSTFNIKQEYGNFKSQGANFIKIDSEYGNVDINKVIKARVSTEHGNITIGTVNDLIAENEFGNITIESITEYLQLENESGNIKINNIVLQKNSSIESNYGDIEIGMTNEIKIDAKTDRGKVKIKNNYKESELLLKVYNEDGDININN